MYYLIVLHKIVIIGEQCFIFYVNIDPVCSTRDLAFPQQVAPLVPTIRTTPTRCILGSAR
jgi:hypothetical protein